MHIYFFAIQPNSHLYYTMPLRLAVTYRHFYSHITFKETGSQAGNVFLVRVS